MNTWIRMACAAVMLALALLGSSAAAIETPGIARFSPGLVRLSALEKQNAPASAQAEIHLDKALYARDLSVLASMLSGTTFDYARDGDTERLRILRGEEALSSILLSQTGDASVVSIAGKAYACDSKEAMQALTGMELPGYDRMASAEQALTGAALLERVPLDAVAVWLESLCAGDVLIGGWTVGQPFQLERTMSDDGTRLTRVDVRGGSVMRAAEESYTITGYLRQPAGRAPKDTFELVLKRDEQNFIELSYSALRENEVTRKDKAGTTSVRTTLRAAGKIAGSRISSRLTVTMKNAWTANGGDLSEKITVSANVEHQDNRPGMRMKRLNNVKGSMRNVIRLTTSDEHQETISLSDEITLEVIMDENTFLSGGADVRMTVGGETGEMKINTDEILQASQEEIAAAMQEEIIRLASAVYPDLSENARKKTTDGL